MVLGLINHFGLLIVRLGLLAHIDLLARTAYGYVGDSIVPKARAAVLVSPRNHRSKSMRHAVYCLLCLGYPRPQVLRRSLVERRFGRCTEPRTSLGSLSPSSHRAVNDRYAMRQLSFTARRSTSQLGQERKFMGRTLLVGKQSSSSHEECASLVGSVPVADICVSLLNWSNRPWPDSRSPARNDRSRPHTCS